MRRRSEREAEGEAGEAEPIGAAVRPCELGIELVIWQNEPVEGGGRAATSAAG
jgi:hypothetical protein